MPYPEESIRQALLAGTISPSEAGHLNFLFTYHINKFLTVKGLRYQQINDVLGALVGAHDEFKRKVEDDYEAIKENQNGRVYTPELWGKK